MTVSDAVDANTDGVEAYQRGHDVLELKDTRSGAWIATDTPVEVDQ